MPGLRVSGQHLKEIQKLDFLGVSLVPGSSCGQFIQDTEFNPHHTLQGRVCSDSHFTDEEPETQNAQL